MRLWYAPVTQLAGLEVQALSSGCERPWLHCATTSGNGLQGMTTELGKSCQSGDAVLALKKFISKCNVDNEKLKEQIAVNKQRDQFLYTCR